MIVTVTLNAAIDKTIVCKNLQLGTITRADEVAAVAGGKGINVARSIHRLKGEVLATGFAGGANGYLIRKLLAAEGIPHRFTKITANSRVCLALVDTLRQTVTEVYEPSPVVEKDEWASFRELLGALAPQASFITFNGSLPGGLDPGAYYDLILWCRELNPGCKIALDTSGAALRAGIRARPDLIKPNRDELEELCGYRLDGDQAYGEAVRQLMADGIELVLVSLGSAGLIFGCQGSVFKAEPLRVPEVKSTVGCGDALLGGVLCRLAAGADLMTAVKYGVAAATSNLTTKSPGYIDPDQVEALYPKVCIRPLD
ncbi:MAG: 1-phosphofructokinase family hexose kinase [Firmicutes bacterium]|nr:1-phosphofructokinase family hexose kinase [Bacillota bacterium]